MTVKASGPLGLQADIAGEFGGTAPHALGEYYRNGLYVTENNTGVPTGGQISISQFYGTVKQFTFSITSNTQNANIRTLAVNAGWDQVTPLICNIDPGVWCWSDTTSTAGVVISGTFAGGLVIYNSGNIIGKGGNGGHGVLYGSTAGGAGGHAISVSSTGVTIVNNSGAYIAGGGGGGGGGAGVSDADQGGGGGGAGGGAGGSSYGADYGNALGGAGGALGAAGSNGAYNVSVNVPGIGGGAGGGGASYNRSSSAAYRNGGGGGGGRVLPGTGGAGGQGYDGSQTIYGGAGGSAGSAGGVPNPFNYSAGGGGGWGAAGSGAGGAGGAGGLAIAGTSPTLINNGTIYGATV